MDETATKFIRIYPSDYKELVAKAKKRRTIIAQVLNEEREIAFYAPNNFHRVKEENAKLKVAPKIP